jgi:hypothetical protein
VFFEVREVRPSICYIADPIVKPAGLRSVARGGRSGNRYLPGRERASLRPVD